MDPRCPLIGDLVLPIRIQMRILLLFLLDFLPPRHLKKPIREAAMCNPRQMRSMASPDACFQEPKQQGACTEPVFLGGVHPLKQQRSFSPAQGQGSNLSFQEHKSLHFKQKRRPSGGINTKTIRVHPSINFTQSKLNNVRLLLYCL